MYDIHVLARVLYTRASTCVYARARPLLAKMRPGMSFWKRQENIFLFSDAYRSRQRKETAIGLIPLPGTHYYPAQPVLQMPRQLDCFQGDDTRLGFWQGRTNSHDGKTYNIIEREIERHRSPPSKRFFIGSGHLLTIPGSALPTIFCRSPARLSYRGMQ